MSYELIMIIKVTSGDKCYKYNFYFKSYEGDQYIKCKNNDHAIVSWKSAWGSTLLKEKDVLREFVAKFWSRIEFDIDDADWELKLPYAYGNLTEMASWTKNDEYLHDYFNKHFRSGRNRKKSRLRKLIEQRIFDYEVLLELEEDLFK